MTANIRRALRPLALATAVFSAGAIAALAADAVPVITVQPQDVTITAGASATLSVEATGTGTLTYQWYVGEPGDTSLPFVGATTETLTTPRLFASANYWVRVEDDLGSIDSSSSEVSIMMGDGTGELILWGVGSREFGAMGDGYGNDPALSPIQVGEDGSAVMAGSQQSLILKNDGTLWKSGGNIAFESDRERLRTDPAPIQIASDVLQAATGGDFTLILTKDGNLWRHFSGITWQIASDVRECAAGFSHGLFVKNDGSLWTLGTNDWGQLGDGTTTLRDEPVFVADNVASISAGAGSSFFVKADNTLWGMGRNESGQLGDGTTVDRHVPVQVAAGVARVVAGPTHSAFIKTDGSLWAMGANSLGQLGDGTTILRQVPVVVATNVVAVAVGSLHTVFNDEEGRLWAVGGNFFGTLGNGTTVPSAAPVEIASDVVAVAAGDSFSLFVKSDGTVWANGNNFIGELGNGKVGFHEVPFPVADDVAIVATAKYHSLLLKLDGSLWAVGDDSYDDNTAITRTSRPQATLIATDVANLATNELHAAFVKNDGSLWTFGSNAFGQLGTGTNNKEVGPVKIAEGVSSVATGSYHTAFVKLDGSLWTAGGNFYGQLGNGGTVSAKLPVEISSNVRSVAAGDRHTLFVKNDDTAWATGDDFYGQFGNAVEPGSEVPVQIGIEVSALSAGEHHSLMLMVDGELRAAGLNDNGQLGDGSMVDRNFFVVVDTEVEKMIGGGRHTAYIKEDGSLWVVGSNYSGQLGDPSSFPYHRVIPLEIAKSVVGVATGANRIFFVQEVHPPVISSHPLDQAVKSDVTIALSVQATSEASLEYQWYRGEAGDTSDPLEGETAAFFTTPALTQTTFYWVRITNLIGSTDSDTATLTVVHPPVIATQPASLTTIAGAMVELSVEATSEVIPDYQWFLGGSGDSSQPIEGATNSTYTTPILSEDVSYWVRISNLAGATDSATANIEVILPPSITAQPVSQNVDSGTDVTLSVVVADERSTVYQWYRGESGDISQPVAGATEATLAVSGLTNDALFWVRVNNLFGSIDSNAASITVTGPILTQQPVSMEETATGAVTLSVGAGASDGSDVIYQWYLNGQAIAGATASTLSIPNVQSFHAGEYTVVVTALGISVASNAALLTVEEPPHSDARLLNLSTRALTLTGSEVLIPGFVIQGTGTKQLLIRAVGPRLSGDPFFVPGVLPDPRLTLKRWNGSSYDDIASNDNWEENTNLADLIQTAAEVFAFGLGSGSLDAALLVELEAGQYTVVAEDGSDGTGVALVELFDADADGDAARLINISSRGFVGTGANIMIPGVVISQEGPKTLLLRAVGPTLGGAPFNVPGVLADPVLTVNSGQETILTNDDWSSDGAMAARTAAVAKQVYAFGLPLGSKDAAFVVTLQPGIYTVQAKGKNGGTGVALVEVYVVP